MGRISPFAICFSVSFFDSRSPFVTDPSRVISPTGFGGTFLHYLLLECVAILFSFPDFEPRFTFRSSYSNFSRIDAILASLFGFSKRRSPQLLPVLSAPIMADTESFLRELSDIELAQNRFPSH